MLVSGGVTGLAWAMNRLAVGEGDVPLGWLLTSVAVGAAAGMVVVAALHVLTMRLLRGADAVVRQRMKRADAFTYWPGLIVLLGAVGIQLAWWLLVLLGVLVAKGVALTLAIPPTRRRQGEGAHGHLAMLFLVSGFAALIYQIVWQRTLFTAFGVNIESITIIVSLFMFGLGVGSFVGGLLAKRFPHRAPLLFLLCEAGIGLFGLVSLPLISWASGVVLHAPLWGVSLAVFALLAVPTTLMGATLPILVGHLYRTTRHVGRSVGLLYCINTVGSAIACFLTADVLFALAGQQVSVLVAAVCNLAVGVLVWRYARSLARRTGHDASADAEAVAPTAPEPGPAGVSRFGNGLVFVLAAATGTISLSQEIVWMRVISYMTGGRPSVFAHVLGWFLLGVAAGALLGKWATQRAFRGVGGSALAFVALMLMVSGVFYYFSIALAAELHAWSPSLGLAATHGIVAVVAMLLGGVFPVLCHVAARSGGNVSMTVSKLYVANIVGSTLGPLATGFVIMDFFTTEQIIFGLSAATLLLGGLTFAVVSRRGAVAMGGVAVSAVLLLPLQGPLYGRLFERLHRGGMQGQYAWVGQNRSGVISVAADPDGDIVYGGGMYDGRFSLDPVVDSNMIRRCYMIAALHPHPRRTLEIGLSTGSWACVMAEYQPIERLEVVEINPGYLDLIRRYSDHAGLLEDPKVRIHIDDGRRWLNRHPNEQFDMILQNTTWHWRSQITNLLSKEYLELCKSRLRPGGVLYWNTTGSPHIPYTAARVFRHVVRYGSFVAASDSPFNLTPDQVRANLLKFAGPDGPVFERSAETLRLLDELAATPLVDLGNSLRRRNDLIVITDDNMATEYRLTPWCSSQWTWTSLLQRVR